MVTRHARFVALSVVLPALAACGTLAPEAPSLRTGPVACAMVPAFTRVDEGGAVERQVFGEKSPAIPGVTALLFIDRLKVNTDGTLVSYNALDPRGTSLAINSIANAMRSGSIADFERLRNAGFPSLESREQLGNVIEFDAASGRPCTREDGYLVSKTSLGALADAHERDGDCEPAKWLDALAVPAIVLPVGDTGFEARGATTRSLVAAAPISDSQSIVFATVGDRGPRDQLGEGSVALNRALNGMGASEIPASYKDAQQRFEGPTSAVLIFGGATARASFPISAASLDAEAAPLFERWGGRRRMAACIAELQ